ncbi:MAG: hypothetical protein K8R87_10580 [Verrucomicrobia bacterium]|nr:hypothetical protein [Verrucomicrobiota bacterium]
MKASVFNTTAALTAAALLANCTNIKDDQTRTRAEGAGAGALLGAGLGAIIGNQHGRAWEGAAIGGAVGALGGLAVGDHVARKKAAYKNQEAWLNACIAQAEKTNSHARSYNASLSNKISSLEQKIKAAKASGNKSELQSLKRSALALQNETKQEIKTVNSEIAEQNRALDQAGNGGSSMTLRTQVGELRSNQSSLNQNETKIADLLRRIDV